MYWKEAGNARLYMKYTEQDFYQRNLYLSFIRTKTTDKLHKQRTKR